MSRTSSFDARSMIGLSDPELQAQIDRVFGTARSPGEGSRRVSPSPRTSRSSSADVPTPRSDRAAHFWPARRRLSTLSIASSDYKMTGALPAGALSRSPSPQKRGLVVPTPPRRTSSSSSEVRFKADVEQAIAASLQDTSSGQPLTASGSYSYQVSSGRGRSGAAAERRLTRSNPAASAPVASTSKSGPLAFVTSLFGGKSPKQPNQSSKGKGRQA